MSEIKRYKNRMDNKHIFPTSAYAIQSMFEEELCFEWKDKDRCISDEGTDLYHIVYCAGDRTDPAVGIYVWSRKG